MKINTFRKDNKLYYYLACVMFGIIVVLSVLLCIPAQKQAEASYYDQKCQSFAIQNANLSKGQIVFIGDSITDLCKLDNYYYDLTLATYNRGIGGDTTAGVLKRLKVSLYDIEPSRVVLLIGGNDILGGKSNDYIVEQYEKILTDIKENLPYTTVLCISIISQNDLIKSVVDINVDKNVEQIMALNPRLKTLVQDAGYTYLDLFSLTCKTNKQLDEHYTDDGIHLNNAGFLVWSNLVLPYL